MTKIELTFKSPTDRISPFITPCDLSWSILNLKEYLSENYPSKPIIESQKIIYSGKLLKNEQILRDIFETKTSAIVHFLCQPSISIDETKQEKIETKDDEKLRAEYQQYLREFYSDCIRNYSSSSPYQQAFLMNQAYMQSYMNYYNQFVTGNENTVVKRTVTNERSSQNHDNGVANNDQRINAANQQQHGMQNAVAAAFNGIVGGGENDNDVADMEPRDFLHYFYLLVRLGLLMLVCYYYSSFYSIIATLLLFGLFVGVNFIRRHNPRRQEPLPYRQNIEIEVPPPPTPETEDQPQNPTEVVSEENKNQEGLETVEKKDTEDKITEVNNNYEQIVQSVSEVPNLPPPGVTDRVVQVAQTSLQFVTSFFLTLFPEPVADIDPN